MGSKWPCFGMTTNVFPHLLLVTGVINIFVFDFYLPNYLKTRLVVNAVTNIGVQNWNIA